MQRLYGDALTRVEMRKPVVVVGGGALLLYAAIVNLDPRSRGLCQSQRRAVQDKAHFTNSEQKVQSGSGHFRPEAGMPASAVRNARNFGVVSARPRRPLLLLVTHAIIMTSLIKRRVTRRSTGWRYEELAFPDGSNSPSTLALQKIMSPMGRHSPLRRRRNHDRIRRFAVPPISADDRCLGEFDV